MKKNRLTKLSIILLLAMLFSLFSTVAYARQDDNDATVEVFRVNRLFVVIKITFPSDINGGFAGTLNGKHFDCVTASSNTLICIGPFRTGPEYATLTIYDQDTKENVLQKTLKSPPTNGVGDEEEIPAPTKEECVECLPEG